MSEEGQKMKETCRNDPQQPGGEMFTLNFTREVLGSEASLKLEQHKVTQTISAESSDIVQAIQSRQLWSRDFIRVTLDGEDVGLVSVIDCKRLPAVGLTDADAQRGGFNTLEELQLALKKAGYRFKPLIDYVFYRVQFTWSDEVEK